MSQNILMMGPIPARQMTELEENYKVHKLWLASDPETKLGEIRQDITGVVSTVWSGVSGKLIKALPNLEIISHFGVGYDNVDVNSAKDQGVVVTNTPDVLTDDTADMGMGLVLAVFRRLVEGDIYVRSGQWARKGPMPLGRSLRGKTMGMIGLGRIGQALAKRAGAFGMTVFYHGPHQKNDFDYKYFSSLSDLAVEADVLVVSCPYNDTTHHMVDGKILKALGKKGVLVNIARGRIVHEQDLVDALENGIIAGAGLDVFENEPDVPSTLSRLDNVVLQPHQGSATHETRAAMAQLVVDNLKLYFEKAEVLTPV